MYGSFEIFPMSLCREIPRRSRCQSRALALIFHLLLNPDALISCRLIPECLVQILRRWTAKNEARVRRRRGREREKGKGCKMSIGDFRNFLLLVLRTFFFFGGNEGHARVKTPRKRTREDHPLFAVQYARSLSFSRLARRESTACFSESSPWFEATTLPRYSCSWTATAPSPSILCPLPLGISLSRSSFRTRHLLTWFVSLSFFHFATLGILSPSCRLVVFTLLHLRIPLPLSTPTSSTRHAVLDIHSISDNLKLSLDDSENWSIANFSEHDRRQTFLMPPFVIYTSYTRFLRLTFVHFFSESSRVFPRFVTCVRVLRVADRCCSLQHDRHLQRINNISHTWTRKEIHRYEIFGKNLFDLASW